MPLQHISDRILSLMGRPGDKLQILTLIAKMRREIENVAIRSAFIVGFPTETKKEFDELLRFVDTARFERLGLFKYSREEHTKAANFKKQVPQNVKEARFDALMLRQQSISREINASFLNKKINVLVDEESADEKDVYLARSEYDAPEVDGLIFVKSKNKKIQSGEFIDVNIIDTYEYDLVGELEN